MAAAEINTYDPCCKCGSQQYGVSIADKWVCRPCINLWLSGMVVNRKAVKKTIAESRKPIPDPHWKHQPTVYCLKCAKSSKRVAMYYLHPAFICYDCFKEFVSE